MPPIRTIVELEALYDDAVPTSITKERGHLTDLASEARRGVVARVIATSGRDGMGCSSRGGPAGFVRVTDPRTLQIPDHRGNDRLDALRNLAQDHASDCSSLCPAVTLRLIGDLPRQHLRGGTA